MINSNSTIRADHTIRSLTLMLVSVALTVMIGCGTGKPGNKKKDDFFTSGSREADQRASQRMARDEQLAGSGEGAGEKGAKKAVPVKPGTDGTASGATNKPAQVEGKLALFDRLGGQPGISNIVADLTPRILQDPRVNWARNGVKRGGFLHRNQSVAWDPNAENVARLKRHLVQFISLATGGPARYDGKDMQAVHAGMHIGNPEFDAVIGDLKASLDKLQIPNKEQKELLAIIESTRPQVVTKR
jgi:hemoglobin